MITHMVKRLRYIGHRTMANKGTITELVTTLHDSYDVDYKAH